MRIQSSEKPFPEDKGISRERKALNQFPVLKGVLKEQLVGDEERIKINKMLIQGKNLSIQLLNLNQPLPKSTAENVLSLTWFMIACAFEECHDPFVRGAVRLCDISDFQSQRLEEFFAKCKEADAHHRRSSHFKEMTVGSQKGLDFPKGVFPCDPALSTILCGRLKDGSFFIKLETEPLSLSKPKQAAKHLLNWHKHVKSGGGKQIVHGMRTRRETDGVGDLNPRYQNVINQWKKIKKLKMNPKEKRIFKMFQKMTHIENELDTDPDLKTHESYPEVKKSIEDFHNQANKHLKDVPAQHRSKISGYEVLLPISDYIKH